AGRHQGPGTIQLDVEDRRTSPGGADDEGPRGRVEVEGLTGGHAQRLAVPQLDITTAGHGRLNRLDWVRGRDPLLVGVLLPAPGPDDDGRLDAPGSVGATGVIGPVPGRSHLLSSPRLWGDRRD